MNDFPSYWSATKTSDANLFTTAAEVPHGWVRRIGAYNREIGQFVDAHPLDHDGDGRKGGSLRRRKA